METIIFNTLLHSLWQGLILAVLIALIIMFSSRATAKLRYNLFVGCLLLFITGVAATFFIELSTTESLHAAQQSNVEPSFAVQNQLITKHADQSNYRSAQFQFLPSIVSNFSSYLSRYSSLIVMAWLLMISAKSIRFMMDIRTLLQLKINKVYAAGNLLEKKVEVLSAQYGITTKIRIMQSGMVQVPMVLGHFKPLILVPLGLVNGLSMEEVEAILSHELAHIKRRDYMVNLLQSVVEILFFFNPAVYWVSNLIRTERENCCDDLAVSDSQTKIHYIKALVSCQEFANAVPAYAMALSGSKNNLVNRVQRLISSRNQTLNWFEKAIVGVTLVFAVVLSSAFSGKPTLQHAVATAKEVISTAANVSPAQDTTARKKGKATRASITQLNGQSLQSNSSSAEQPESPERREQHAKATDTRHQIFNKLVKDGIINADDDDVSFILDNESLVVNGHKQGDEVFQSYKTAFIRFEKQNITYQKNSNISSNSVTPARPATPATPATPAIPATAARPATPITPQSPAAIKAAVPVSVNVNVDIQSEQAKANADARKAQAEAHRAQVMAQKAQIQADAAAAQAQKAAQKAQLAAQGGNSLTNELIADHLIKNRGNFTYKLNKDELVVDGEEQPQAIHRKYMKKYLKNTNQRITTTAKSD